MVPELRRYPLDTFLCGDESTIAFGLDIALAVDVSRRHQRTRVLSWRRQLDSYTGLPELRDQLGTPPLEGVWITNAYPLVFWALILWTGAQREPHWRRLMSLVGVGVARDRIFPANIVAHRSARSAGCRRWVPSGLALVQITFIYLRERRW